MIHPINIPDDLLAVNPQRPQLIEPKRMRPKIIYSKEGRKFNQEGVPLSPRSPTGMWNDFFLRSFMRRIACEQQADTAEKSSVDTLIDVVDLQPSPSIVPSGPNLDVNWNVIGKQTGPSTISESMANMNLKEKSAENTVHSSLKTDRADVESTDTDDENSFNASASFGKSARLPSRRKSAKVNPEVIKPILTPCCNTGKRPTKFERNTNATPLKEFARFDFSHSNLFSDQLHNNQVTENNQKTEEQTEDELASQRKRSLLLLPNPVGSRIWTSVERASKPKSSNKLAPTLSLPVECIRQRPSELLFRVVSVATCRQKRLHIALEIHNSLGKELRFQILEHVHEAVEDKIEEEILKSEERVVVLKGSQDTKIEISMDITETMERLFQHRNKYLIITLHGRILK
ncbi:hypothetical protein DdX_14269 [Ditylenchus destructor]|uniref:Uncharacterized protein n=1 Tax=Ditylenchus destructor TaxID=166010 RepID=A0AAD4MS38_9BILA|nr:hypothetical protein DdX_14269 [Ditylenchus destructor]